MEIENQYVKQYPDLMSGKKIMYVHGFGSSAQSGTVAMLRTLLPNATVVARDIRFIHRRELRCCDRCARRKSPT